jgi:hypothetical protein
MGQIELGKYIVERLKQLDVKQVFGLPGTSSSSSTPVTTCPLDMGVESHDLTILPLVRRARNQVIIT